MELCNDCPRQCGAPRGEHEGRGFCGMGTLPVVARAALHRWEEPCISGGCGSGTVFFSGCSLRCRFCQNEPIRTGRIGKEISVGRLQAIYRELIGQGAHNINLVTGSHFVRAIAESLIEPLPVPVVYNCGGYESPGALRMLAGKVQIYLPDLKYMSAALAAHCSCAPDYPQIAKSAIEEMFRQTGPCVLSGDGLLQSGVLIRHLLLPGCAENAMDVIDWIAQTFPPGSVLFSLMGQYIPFGEALGDPLLGRRVTPEEYRRVQEYLLCTSLEDGYVQELSSASEQYIPDFSLQGVEQPWEGV